MGRRARPNVLLITLDQFRGDCLSSAGHPVVRTPNLDRLAAAGVRLRRHYSQATPCAPGRAALYTGTYQMNNRVVGNGTPLDDRFDNVARVARRAGYAPDAVRLHRPGRRPTARARTRPTRGASNPWGSSPASTSSSTCPARTRRGSSGCAALGHDVPDDDHAVAARRTRSAGGAQHVGVPHRSADRVDRPPGRAVVRPRQLPAAAPAVRGGGGVGPRLRPRRGRRPDRTGRARSAAPPARRPDAPSGDGRAAPTIRAAARPVLRDDRRGRRSARPAVGALHDRRVGRHPRDRHRRSRRAARRSRADPEARVLRGEPPRRRHRARPRGAAGPRHGRRAVHRERRRLADDLRGDRRRRPAAVRRRAADAAAARRGAAVVARRGARGSSTGARRTSTTTSGRGRGTAASSASTSPSGAAPSWPTCSSATARGGASTSPPTRRGAPRSTTRRGCCRWPRRC